MRQTGNNANVDWFLVDCPAEVDFSGWRDWLGIRWGLCYRFSAFWLRSKCSICSYQLNIWYVAPSHYDIKLIFGRRWDVLGLLSSHHGSAQYCSSSGNGPTIIFWTKITKRSQRLKEWFCFKLFCFFIFLIWKVSLFPFFKSRKITNVMLEKKAIIAIIEILRKKKNA